MRGSRPSLKFGTVSSGSTGRSIGGLWRTTPRTPSRRSTQLARSVARCRLCGDAVTPPPILWARPGQRNLLVGQAPGLGRGRDRPAVRRSRRSDAAPLARAARHHRSRELPRALRRRRGAQVLSRARSRADAATACRPRASASAAYPGPTPPCGSSILVLVVPGRASRDRRLARPRAARRASIGRRFEVDGRAVVPLPHPSGASAWTNLPGASRADRAGRRADRRGIAAPRRTLSASCWPQTGRIVAASTDSQPRHVRRPAGPVRCPRRHHLGRRLAAGRQRRHPTAQGERRDRRKVKNHSLTGADILLSSLGKVPLRGPRRNSRNRRQRDTGSQRRHRDRRGDGLLDTLRARAQPSRHAGRPSRR